MTSPQEAASDACCQPAPIWVRTPLRCTWPDTDCYDNGPRAASILPCPDVWREVAAERERAHAKHRETSMEQQPVDALLRLSILTEEVGEVAKELNDARHSGHLDYAALRTELIQVAAMAGAWAAALTPYAQGAPHA